MRQAYNITKELLGFQVEPDEKSLKDLHDLEERKAIFARAIEKHPDLIPINCIRKKGSAWVDTKKKKSKYLAKGTTTVHHFTRSIVQSMSINPSETIFIVFEGKTLVKPTLTMGEVYEKYKDEDGFLYLEYFAYNCFG